MSSARTLLVMGTRPEAIKMAPLVKQCLERGSGIDPVVCFTGQHREMLAQVAEYFGIQADLDLDVMRPNQTLASLTSRCLEGLDRAITQYQPDYVVAQGDTTSVMAASIAAFYRRTPFVHVEAGLRTGDLNSPWPEEFNRRVPAITAALHCAPTLRAAKQLVAEGVEPEAVRLTGNTVIDALLWTVARERQRDSVWQDKYRFLGDRRMVLVTGHRRENFGQKFESICDSIATLASRHGDTEFIYPVHLNPQVREPVFRLLADLPNVHLTEPASYPEFVWLMDRSHVILTDSGGVQEEAPSLKKPVVVMRENTERPEAVEAGAVRLVGTSRLGITRAVEILLTDQGEYDRSIVQQNPYGDGNASRRIVKCLAAGDHQAKAVA